MKWQKIATKSVFIACEMHHEFFVCLLLSVLLSAWISDNCFLIVRYLKCKLF